jgi:hypothetical protein
MCEPVLPGKDEVEDEGEMSGKMEKNRHHQIRFLIELGGSQVILGFRKLRFLREDT